MPDQIICICFPGNRRGGEKLFQALYDRRITVEGGRSPLWAELALETPLPLTCPRNLEPRES